METAYIDAQGNISNASGEIIGKLDEVVDANGNVVEAILDVNGNPINIGDNTDEVISKKRNVTIYLNSKTNPASIIKEIKIKNDKEKAKLNEFYKSENPLLKRDHKNILTLLSRKEVNINTFQFNYMYYPVNLQEFVKKKNEFSGLTSRGNMV